MTNELVVRDKVQRFTREVFNVVMLDDDGDLVIPYESTRVFISVIAKDLSDEGLAEFYRENELSETMVYMRAIVLVDAVRSPELLPVGRHRGDPARLRQLRRAPGQ